MATQTTCDICKKEITYDEYNELLTCYMLDEIFNDDEIDEWIKKLGTIDIYLTPMPEFTGCDVCKGCYKNLTCYILNEIIRQAK